MDSKSKRVTIVVMIMLGVLALGAISASAQWRLENAANLIPGQRVKLQCLLSQKELLFYPIPNSATHDSVSCDLQVTLISKDGAWARIRTDQDRTGYVNGFSLASIASSKSSSDLPKTAPTSSAGSSNIPPATPDYQQQYLDLMRQQLALQEQQQKQAAVLGAWQLLQQQQAQQQANWQQFYDNALRGIQNIYRPIPNTYTPILRPPLHCTSSVIGYNVVTNCQ